MPHQGTTACLQPSSLTCVHQDTNQLPPRHDELGHHVHIVIAAGAQGLGRGLPWPEPLIQLQASNTLCAGTAWAGIFCTTACMPVGSNAKA